MMRGTKRYALLLDLPGLVRHLGIDRARTTREANGKRSTGAGGDHRRPSCARGWIPYSGATQLFIVAISVSEFVQR